MLSEESIKDFQKIYYEKYHERIDKQEALRMGLKLINLIKLVYRPIPKEGTDKKL